jgi:hypothetical protein
MDYVAWHPKGYYYYSDYTPYDETPWSPGKDPLD